MLKHLIISLLSTALVFSLSGCGGDDASTSSPTPVKVSVLHASPDAPKVDVLINSDAVLSNVDYTQGAALNDVYSGSQYSLSVEGILPGNSRAEVISPFYFNPIKDRRYGVFVSNDVSSLETFTISAETADVAADKVRVQVIHATASAPTVDVYVTAPGADITTISPLGTLSYKESLDPVTVPSGNYEIFITPANSKTIIFDSGTVTLAGGSDLMVAAIANAGNNGTAPVQLAVLDGESASRILDVNTPASVRVIHASPDAPAVDVAVDDNFIAPLVTNLAYPDFTPYVDVPEATYNVKVAPTGTTTAVINTDLSLAKGSMSSVYAVNVVANIEPLVLSDDNRAVATEAKVRILHASPSAPNVDIYVTAPNADIFNATPAFTDVPFKAETGYVGLGAGDYQVRVTPTGSKTVVIDTGSITLETGKIYTAVARDNGAGFGLILLDDFN